MWNVSLLLWVPAGLTEDSIRSIWRLYFHADLLKASCLMEIFFLQECLTVNVKWKIVTWNIAELGRTQPG